MQKGANRIGKILRADARRDILEQKLGIAETMTRFRDEYVLREIIKKKIEKIIMKNK